MDEADLVFHDAVFGERVAIWCDLFDPFYLHAELVSDASFRGVDIGFIQSRMSATAIRPRERPGFFHMASLL